MPNKMLIDATHPEETRVVVLRGNRVEEFDFESANRKQLRGNIYLAKVTRVEPSLQAAFVDYGGNRHGFLAFSEIHPDYYQIPVADRQALIAEEERAQRAADDDADHRARGGRGRRHRHRGADRNRDVRRSEPLADEALVAEDAARTVAEIPVERRHCRARRRPTQPLEAAAEAAPTPADPDAPDEAREAYESPMGDVELPPEHVAEEAEAETARRPCRKRRGGSRRRADRDDAGEQRASSAEPTPERRRRRSPPKTATARTPPKKKPSNPSAAPTRWKKRRSARRASAASTRSRKSSSAGR